MRVELLFFAALRERIGLERLPVDLPEGSTVRDLKIRLERIHPVLTSMPYLVAVNRNYADSKTVLKPGDELAFLPPVSGG